MYCRRFTIDLTTATGGAATGYTSGAVNGRILSIQYVKDATTPFADGVDFTITLETTGQTLWTEANVNASAIRSPRQPTHDGAGVASLYAAGGEPAEGFIYAADERVKVVIAAGGDAKLGRIYVTTG